MIKRGRLLRVIVLLPGATDLDLQGRIKGSLDVPLSETGNDQARQSASELREYCIDVIYCGPCEAARQTANLVANRQSKVRVNEELRNLDRGLWHGKRVEELRDSQPRLYRQWQENPESVCPPGGESFEAARNRIKRAMSKIIRKHKNGTIAIVIPEPAASLLRQHLDQAVTMGDLWQIECCSGRWASIEFAEAESSN